MFNTLIDDQGKALEENHPDTLRSQHGRAMAVHQAGDSEGAIQILEQVIAVQGSLLDDDHPDILRSRHDLEEIGASLAEDSD